MKCQFKPKAVYDCIQWNGDNIAEMEEFLGYEVYTVFLNCLIVKTMCGPHVRDVELSQWGWVLVAEGDDTLDATVMNDYEFTLECDLVKIIERCK